MKTACIYHSIDLDGWMSAAIVKHWFLSNLKDNDSYDLIENNKKYEQQRSSGNYQNLTFIGYNYGQPIPDLSEYDKVIMCDISFPIEEMEKLRQHLQDNFIWIDHHISAIKAADERTNNYYDGIRDTKFAACELTWIYFMEGISKKPSYIKDIYDMPEIVRLLGRYDCFGHKGTLEEKKVLEFQYGARMIISNYEQAYDFLISNINCGNSVCDSIHIDGAAIYRYLCTEAKQTYKNGFELFIGQSNIKLVDINTIPDLEKETLKNAQGTYLPFKFICINKERFNPINFAIDYHKDGYDGCACFHYANGMWNFSLYNDNGLVDCSTIAEQYEGGGHKGAAGFRLTQEQFNNLISK